MNQPLLVSGAIGGLQRRVLQRVTERLRKPHPTAKNDLLESVQEVARGVSFDVSFSLLRSDFSSRGTTPTAQNTALVLHFVVRRYLWSQLRDQEVGGSNPLAPTY
jgi:hypothetical protein